MLEIKNLSVKLKEEEKEILKDIHLTVKSGEIHLITGQNGSGKSSLVNVIMGHPNLEITRGSIILTDITNYELLLSKEIIQREQLKITEGNTEIDLTNVSPNIRSLLGIYLATQYPVEVPGVSLSQYLRLLYNIRRPKEDQLPVFKFRKILEEKAEIINFPKHLLKRNLNEGFSGGEKKKTEILQMLITQPSYIMLDEIDSGLDKQSIIDVFGGLRKYKEQNPNTAFIIITHYDKVLEYLSPDVTHEMLDGRMKSEKTNN